MMRKILLPILLLPLCLVLAQNPPQQDPQGAPPAQKKGRRPPPPGVSTEGVKREMATITPDAVFPVEGTPDWQVLTDDAVWVTNGPKNTVHRLDPKTNKVLAAVTVGTRPCSGLAAGFGTIWVPNCGDRSGAGKSVSRIDMKTNAVVATIRNWTGAERRRSGDRRRQLLDRQRSEGRALAHRPATNKVTAEITVPEKSAAVNFGEGAAWVTTPGANTLTRVDAKTNQVAATIAVGPGPRFLTVGAGSIWTLNQGDGTVSRVDGKTAKVLATIEAGIPGWGGEIAYGEGHVWATDSADSNFTDRSGDQ